MWRVYCRCLTGEVGVGGRLAAGKPLLTDNALFFYPPRSCGGSDIGGGGAAPAPWRCSPLPRQACVRIGAPPPAALAPPSPTTPHPPGRGDRGAAAAAGTRTEPPPRTTAPPLVPSRTPRRAPRRRARPPPAAASWQQPVLLTGDVVDPARPTRARPSRRRAHRRRELPGRCAAHSRRRGRYAWGGGGGAGGHRRASHSARPALLCARVKKSRGDGHDAALHLDSRRRMAGAKRHAAATFFLVAPAPAHCSCRRHQLPPGRLVG